MEPGRLNVRRSVSCTALLLALAGLSACAKSAPEPTAVETEVPEDLRAAQAVRPVNAGEGTPMKDRVAVIGVLNKRNDLSQDWEMKPGTARRWGDVIVRLAACERTAPWESPRQTGAFAQVFIQASGGGGGGFKKVFSGWLFKESPGLNVVEHPIYDVWVKDCRMSFDGEKPAPAASESSAPKASGSAAAPAPAASPSAAT